LAGLEKWNALGGHIDARPGLRFASDARLPLSRAETAESANLDLVASAQGANHAVEDRLDDYLGVLPCHLDDSRDFFDQFGFGHVIGHPLFRVNSSLLLWSWWRPRPGADSLPGACALRLQLQRGGSNRFSSPLHSF